jgi:hypothetical protein
VFQILATHGEAHIGHAVPAGCLYYHIHLEVGFGQRTENRGGNTGLVAYGVQGNTGLVLVIGDAGNYNLFHDLILLSYQGTGSVGKGAAHQ